MEQIISVCLVANLLALYASLLLSCISNHNLSADADTAGMEEVARQGRADDTEAEVTAMLLERWVLFDILSFYLQFPPI